MPPNSPPNDDLREMRGRSIMQIATKGKVGTNVLTDRTVRTPHLSDTIMSDLKHLYPYICEVPYANIPFSELVYHFRCDTYPEGEVFWWQLQVLAVLHALNLWSYPGFPLDRPPPPMAKDLGEQATLDKYFRFPEEQRKKFHLTVFNLLMVPEQFSVDCPEDLCILECTKNICDVRRPQSIRIEKGRALRYAKAYGAACFTCKSMGKGKMVCSRCNQVFYCGRECQKAHWPEHKKECVKGDASRATASVAAKEAAKKPPPSLIDMLLRQ